jgi:hypothetical protein
MNVLIDFRNKNNRLKKIYLIYKKMKKNTFIKVITFFIIIVAAISLVFWSAIMLLGWNTTQENNGNIEYIEDTNSTWLDVTIDNWETEENNNIEIIAEESTGDTTETE